MARRDSDRTTWVLAGAVALLVVAGAALLFRVPETPDPAVSASDRPDQGSVALEFRFSRSESDQVIENEYDMHDRMPLFLPTPRNARPGGVTVEEALQEPGLLVARPISGQLEYPEERASVDFPPRVALPERQADVLAFTPEAIRFLGMGQVDRASADRPARTATIEVSRQGSGEPVLQEAITGSLPLVESTWSPMELLVSVDVSGIVIPPFVVKSSTVAAIDSFLREYVVSGARLGEKLPPGTYLVSVGP